MKFNGCGTALVTPFKNGAVDYKAYEDLVRRQVEAGVDFLVPLATTAETPTLSPREKRKILRLTKKNCGSLPLLVGVGSNSVAGTLGNMKLCDFGADGFLVVVPFYNKPTQQGQIAYFKEIARHTTKPVFIYNVPGRTGANMLPQTCLTLAREVENIVGIKEASGKLEQVEEICKGAGEGFTLLSGDDDLTLDMIRLGGKGAISVASNIAPQKVAQVIHLALEGNLEKAAACDKALAKLYKDCFIESNPIPVKAGLNHLGLCSAEMRLPLSEAQEQTKTEMASCIDEL